MSADQMPAERKRFLWDIVHRVPEMPDAEFTRKIAEMCPSEDLGEEGRMAREFFETERADPGFPYDSVGELIAALVLMGAEVRKFRSTGMMRPRADVAVDEATNLARVHERMAARVRRREQLLTEQEDALSGTGILFLSAWIRDAERSRYSIGRKSLIEQALRSETIGNHIGRCPEDVHAIWRALRYLYS